MSDELVLIRKQNVKFKKKLYGQDADPECISGEGPIFLILIQMSNKRNLCHTVILLIKINTKQKKKHYKVCALTKYYNIILLYF